jgi:hypothetical protein
MTVLAHRSAFVRQRRESAVPVDVKQRLKARRSEQDRRPLLYLIWAYFLLLVFEGVLRKWVVPAFSDALLLVRDPVALAIIFLGYSRGYLPSNRLMRVFGALFMAFLALGALHASMQTVPLAVSAFGLRTYFLHPPLIFIMARVLTPKDIRRLGIAVIVLALPFAMLMARQFQSDPTDWINVGAGANRMQIITAMDKIRPAGPFSFISGPLFYYSIVFAVLLGSQFGRPVLPTLVQTWGWVSVVLATAVSGSRALIANLVPVGVAAALVLIRRPGLLGRRAQNLILPAAAVAFLWSMTVVQEGVVVLEARFELAGGTENMLSRLVNEYIFTSSALTSAPFFGAGLGLGTNVGGTLAAGGNFQLGESEWTRIIYEAGPILGTAFVAWRVWMVVLMAGMSFKAAARGDALPLLLLGACANNIILGPWGQPTTLGFAVLGAGLCMAAARESRADTGVHGKVRRRVAPRTAPQSPDPNPRGTGVDVIARL